MWAVLPRILRPAALAALAATTLAVGTLAVTALLERPGPTAHGPAAVVVTGSAGGGEAGEGGSDPQTSPAPEPTAGQTTALPSAPDDAGVLPGAPVPTDLGGRLVVVPGDEPAVGPGSTKRVRVEVEAGLPVDPDAFARFVMDTLTDARGWGADGSVSFARTDDEADIRVVVASPATIDAMCAPLETNGRWSCGRYGHAALNADRWVHGAQAFLDAGGTLTQYRQYLVNHEVGHLLGAQHTGCPAAGRVAPIMLQQSLGLNGCVPNGWPHP